MDRSELELIELIRQELSAHQGAAAGLLQDDAAVVETQQGVVVTSADCFVEAVHFTRGSSSLTQIGHKMVQATVSDLAAVGVMPKDLYVCLGLPDDLGDDGFLELYRGIAASARELGAAVSGGDLSRSKALFGALTAVGWAPSAEATVGRDGARPGDLVAVSGELGGAGAGLASLNRDLPLTDLEPEEAAQLVDRQINPKARLDLGTRLAKVGVTAMIDVSDGIASDSRHLAVASNVRLSIRLEGLPLQSGVTTVAKALGVRPSEFAALAGEDYELLFTFSPDRLDEVRVAANEVCARISLIGDVTESDGSPNSFLVDDEGNLAEVSGFDHFG